MGAQRFLGKVARRLLRELAATGHALDDVGVCIRHGAGWLQRLLEWFERGVDHQRGLQSGVEASEVLH